MAAVQVVGAVAVRGMRQAAVRCSRYVASESDAAVASRALRAAAPGNLTRFTDVDGVRRWGLLVEGETGHDGTPAVGPEPKAIPIEGDPLAGPSAWRPATGSSPHAIAKVHAPLPVDPPPAIICLGLNYRAHAAETGQALPKFPIFFYKSPASIAAPGDAIKIPSVARAKPEVDFEAELAAVVGSAICDATPDEALAAVLGITAANDVSARRWQGKKGGGQWSRAKSFDSFCPVGPSLAPLAGGHWAHSALVSGGAGLRLGAAVNGEMMQDASTSDMIFSLAQVVSFLSEGTTLLPGTLILTGTPCGVGFARSPPQYLASGDEVVINLEGVGSLANPLA
eukprot:gnl/TRDRNA2_/TRDRNA2_44255_c1_seq1.p1 gnl/TRDRNA2_/TRDRNA2_44255_c1~~gnl/TRDRNA2_/TRDRNA2_44255_c1_seq1.p1  ORF type:complete len:339 (+),score=60.97 gnl/TRDRNA2_/TRDRNA2_44255_c1_seq1:47-1063(+)